ncbi:Crp/Fnr family transcriptional regulator [Helicobacter turcicus]|uniref:Crp/Fnr family transcriptional regulator n=1 Tax=Helicobacter turcicus TaxID=2867412 RepID=A0ABS7JPV3_9HELI|nr:Crp/Fnr family transcriptional regulator [Helicobacter turcicus]MBX7491441.1 Crp/Fnr family transcriptional regulator [Helicobacter turcicus]MBX7545901.1 Crp/Fnr family transcriptional regulator [Helicobacter turcicus]
MEDYFKLLYNIGYKRFFNKDEILFFEGETPKKLLVLLSGKVRIYKSTQPAKDIAPREKTLHYISAPNFLAEMPSLLKQPFPASAVCAQDCEVLEINLETFQKQCAENPNFYQQLIASLCQKIRILEALITESHLSLKDKLMSFLQNNTQNLSTLTQREIAKRLNTSPESLSRIIRELKTQGRIETKKGKIILK